MGFWHDSRGFPRLRRTPMHSRGGVGLAGGSGLGLGVDPTSAAGPGSATISSRAKTGHFSSSNGTFRCVTRDCRGEQVKVVWAQVPCQRWARARLVNPQQTPRSSGWISQLVPPLMQSQPMFSNVVRKCRQFLAFSRGSQDFPNGFLLHSVLLSFFPHLHESSSQCICTYIKRGKD